MTMPHIVTMHNHNESALLTKIVDDWKISQFQNRKDIFQDALWAHKQNRFTLSVPALVFQVEGIIREFIKVSYGYTHKRFEKVEKIFKNKIDQLNTLPTDREITYKDVREIQNYYNLKILEDKLYSSYEPGKDPDPDWVNRHAIGHGLSTTYASMENSTWLFLLLDTLHSMLEQIS